MHRHELTDTQFALLVPYLPPSGMVGHPWSDHRPILNGLFWKLRTGAPVVLPRMAKRATIISGLLQILADRIGTR